MPLEDEPDELALPVRIVDPPLNRLCGRDAGGMPPYGAHSRRRSADGSLDLEVKFMIVAHGKAEDGLPFSERIDLEAFALS